MGGKSAVRLRRGPANPESCEHRPGLRLPPSGVPATSRAEPPAPSAPSPRWGWAGPQPPAAPLPCSRLPALRVGASSRDGRGLQRPDEAEAQPGSPQATRPPASFGEISLSSARGENGTHRNPIKLKPGCAAGWGTAAWHARTHDPSRAPLLQCVRTNHRDHLKRLARYSPPRDRLASPPPVPPSYIRDRGGVLVPRLGGFQRATRNQPQRGDPDSTSLECGGRGKTPDLL